MKLSRFSLAHPKRALAGAVMALAAMSGLAPDAGAATGTCRVNRVAYATADSQNATSSIGFVAVPFSSVNITVGGAEPGCVIVNFSASARVSNSLMYVRARIVQLNAIAEPDTAFFTGLSGVVFNAQAMQFVFPQIPPGQYTVQMQFRSQNGQLVVVGTRTLTVQFRN